jgi:hypothetical protein
MMAGDRGASPVVFRFHTLYRRLSERWRSSETALTASKELDGSDGQGVALCLAMHCITPEKLLIAVAVLVTAIVHANEACDAGPNNGPGQLCNATCQLNACGDADPGPGESCDDGNIVDDHACPNNCI